MDREILIFIWHENSFTLPCVCYLHIFSLVFWCFFLHICMDGWMDGWDGWEAQSRIGENITGKKEALWRFFFCGGGGGVCI